MVFLEVRREPGVYYRVTVKIALQNSNCSVTSGFLCSWEIHLGILLEVWQGNRDASRGEARDPVSLCSWHRDIGIPINFQEESGIVSF